MGRFSRSWQLVKESFAVLRSDKQLMLFPILSAVTCLITTAMIITGGAVAFFPAIRAAAAAHERWNPNASPALVLAVFGLWSTTSLSCSLTWRWWV